jgi:hypothetical protein
MEVTCRNGRVALVDDADGALVVQYQWSAFKVHKCWYVCTETPRGRIYMHRLIMDAPEGMEVDHISGNGLDNRRGNLRICTHAQNLANQRTQRRSKYSPYKGVTFERRNGKWLAQTKVMQEHINLGRYDSDTDAAAVYNEAARLFFGDYARPNVLPQGYDSGWARQHLMDYLRAREERLRVRRDRERNTGKQDRLAA